MIVLDNATWHNRIIDETTLSKRSWPKELLIDWLRRHNISLLDNGTKAELIELALSNLPEKHYVTNELAAKYNITILRQGHYFRNISLLRIITYRLLLKHHMLHSI